MPAACAAPFLKYDVYCLAVIDVASRVCAVVDPVEPVKVLAAAATHGVTITTIL